MITFLKFIAGLVLLVFVIVCSVILADTIQAALTAKAMGMMFKKEQFGETTLGVQKNPEWRIL